VDDLAVAEFHNTDRVFQSPLLRDGVFRDPEIPVSQNPLDLEAGRLAGMMTARGLENCFARGFARLTGDRHKWHRHRKYRIPRLHRRLPTRARANSGLYGFVPLAWTVLDAVLLSCSSTLWNETRNAGFHHFIQPLSGLNSIDFVKRTFWKS
jgi:hypothetical protein